MRLLHEIEINTHFESFLGDEARDVVGIVTVVFEVGHISVSNSEGHRGRFKHADGRDLVLRSVLPVIDYVWPNNDSVRELISLIQPNDIVAVLQPVTFNGDGNILLAFRFIAGVGERRRFMEHFRGDVPLEANCDMVSQRAWFTELFTNGEKRCDIRSIHIRTRSAGVRGAEKRTIKPDMGRLCSGEEYLVY